VHFLIVWNVEIAHFQILPIYALNHNVPKIKGMALVAAVIVTSAKQLNSVEVVFGLKLIAAINILTKIKLNYLTDLLY
jgi:hypothetical protein